MESEFQCKKVLVTGSASGIGKEQALAFLNEQAIVYGIDTNVSDINHPNYTHFTGSVTDGAFIQRVSDEIGDVDILCNTAGVLDAYKPLLETDEALWDRIMNTNVKGMYVVTKAVLPKMVANQKGIVINMASIAGMIAGGGGAAYTASKHAVIGFTKQLSYDYCKDGIRVNGIAPGAIKTAMNKADFEGDGAMAKWVADETPAKRWANPEEVANVTLFLASTKSDYIHSTIIPIDGGWMNK